MQITQIDPHYDVGTATMSTSSRTVTGQGTQWASLIVPGDQVFGADGRMGGVVESVNSNTSITLVKNWRGANQSAGLYTIQRLADSARVEEFSQRLLNLLLGGNLSALGGLTGVADKLPFFDGPGSLSLADFPAWSRALLAETGQLPNARIRNDLTPDKAFRRGNVLGAVSQSGSVPTGALIEHGASANGEYVRLANGTQICIIQNVTFTRQTNDFLSFSWTLPAAFNSAYAQLAVVQKNFSLSDFVNCDPRDVGTLARGSGGSSSSASMFLNKATAGNFASGAAVSGCNVMLQGRWI